ncbi:solute carrier family 3 member 2b [Alosa pseudoharengus]|uniref:solute carrier family 3 member 2b n=1 Tax=Alosa pseudoharengus TaxID=34774 RepID=UPI003F89BABE
MSTEVDMKDVELNEVEQEKQPMTAGDAGNGDASSPTSTEKNGVVKVKMADETETKFTGLSKDELLKVAGTPGWVRTRWALLILFWLGWLGMLAGAIGIIIQAPRCKPLPEMNWWNEGPLYEIGDVQAFSENLEGLKQKIDSLAQLKVKGLVVGPIHKDPSNNENELDLNTVSVAGSLTQFKALLDAAHKKGINVVLDLTPNYLGQQAWFDNMMTVADKVKVALVHWQMQGVDGFKFSGFERVVEVASPVWEELRGIIKAPQNGTKEKGLLMGVTDKTSPEQVGRLLNSSGVDLLLSGILRASGQSGMQVASAAQQLLSSQNQTKLAWNVGDREQGHLASLVGADLVKFNQMLLLTMPGTPVFNYGDEIGLEDEGATKFPQMIWYKPEDAKTLNGTAKDEMERRLALRSFFKSLSDLRSKERSLLYGDFVPLHSSNSSLAYLRSWDQSPRYLAAFNWGSDALTLRLEDAQLPEQATVEVSTDSEKLQPKSQVDLKALELGAGQAVLLQFPYTG